jgi:hypothetical protein
MHADDMIISVRQRKLACVLDPTLILGSSWGPGLALRLTRVMEAWLTRAFWQVIDASDIVIPRLGEATAPDDQSGANCTLRPTEAALTTWIAMRDSTDAGSWPFRWIGDNFAESQVGDAADNHVVERYELLLNALMRRQSRENGAPPPVDWSAWWNPLDIALDTLALSAALDAAIVLTVQVGDEAPWPVKALQHAGAPAERLDPIPMDSLFAAERALLRDALAAAGIAGMAQRLPRLAALHVIAVRGSSDETHTTDGESCDEACDPWHDGQAWWYFL